jgi:hypothetical protein
MAKIKVTPTASNLSLHGHVIGNHPATGLPASLDADPHGTAQDPAIPAHDRVPAMKPGKPLSNSPKSPTAAGGVVD